MPHVLETKGGGRPTPLDVFDVMEAVEGYMGMDVRQYLEEYLLEVESEAGEIVGEEVYGHYKQMPMSIRDETGAAVRLMEKPHMNRRAVRVTLDIILKMAERGY